ncbi:cytochrome P450 [Streptomyces sp. Z26]|uniref:cytochrome P450 n=1 Tax=Streptomyces sp. Z26 TaxID=2500177 RepID=UPI000EF14C36|nr:cytochrome P450 [Streptomyces sp. Z26]RLL68240.1 cytochrome P450 [Streptomyces sp. Z26]
MTTQSPAATHQQADEALIQLLTPPHPKNPFPLYETIQSAGKVHDSSATLGIWALFGYEEINQFLKRPDVLSGARAAALRNENWEDHFALRLHLKTMPTLNQPDHGRIRGLVTKVFTARRINAMQPMVERVTRRMVDELAAAAEGGEVVDLVDVLANPYPVAVISEVLGLPYEDGKYLWEKADTWSKIWSGIYPDEVLQPANEAAEELYAYFQKMSQERRTSPREDLVSKLVAEADDGRIDEDELMGIIMLLFTAGFAATTNVITSGVLALKEHPEELARWRADKSITPLAVEELLRHTMHNTAASRVTSKPTVIAGKEIPAGVHVLTMLAAANRDPLQFPDPHRLNLTRDDGPHMSLSGGSHFCFGGSLARVEIAELFPMLIDTFSTIEVAGEPELQTVMGLTSYSSLPVRLGR